MQSNRRCAYCGAERELTREHIFPGFICSREKSKTNGALLSNVSDKGRNKIVATETTLADVCATCNNGFLSQLDEYGSKLYDKYFSAIPQSGKRIEFRCEFDLLARWLLKLSYNAARTGIWSSYYREYLLRVTDYIRGEVARPPQLYIYLQLITAAILTPLQKQKNLEENNINSDTLEPHIRRLGGFGGEGIAAGFIVGMNAYQFHSVFWDDLQSVRQRKNLEIKFLRQTLGVTRLRVDSPKTIIYPSSLDILKLAEKNFCLRRNATEGTAWVRKYAAKKIG